MSRPPTFTRKGIRPTIRAKSSRRVIRRMGSNSFFVVYVVSPTACRCVNLVYFFVRYRYLEGVRGEFYPLTFNGKGESINYRFLCNTCRFLGICVTLGRGSRVNDFMGAKDGVRNIFAFRAARWIQFTRGVPSREVVKGGRFLRVVGGRF